MKKLLFCLILAFSQGVCAQGQSSTVKLVFFGDSLTDNGNFYRTSLGLLPKSPPYFEGRFSDGPTWAEHLADDQLRKHNISSENYAVGGSTVLLHNPFEGYLPYTLGMEVDKYFLNNVFNDKSHTLYFVWMGANDYLPQKTFNISIVEAVIKEIQTQLEKLLTMPDSHFLIFNLPDMGKTPRANEGNRDLLTQYSIAHNEKLFAMITALSLKHPQLDLQLYNINSLFKDFIAHPQVYNQKYGCNIQDVTHACWEGAYTLRADQISQNLGRSKAKNNLTLDTEQLTTFVMNSPDLLEAQRVGQSVEAAGKPCDHPEQYLFWDSVHASAVTQRTLAKTLIEFMEG